MRVGTHLEQAAAGQDRQAKPVDGLEPALDALQERAGNLPLFVNRV